MNTRRMQKIQKKMTKIFLWSLIVPTLLWIVVCIVGLISPSVKEGIDYDLGENRKQAAFPDSFSGHVFSDIESYYNDHAPFRSVLISIDTKLGYSLEAPYKNGLGDALVAIFHKDDKGTDESFGYTKETEAKLDVNDIFGTTEQAIEETISIVVSGTTEEGTASAEETIEEQSEPEATEAVRDLPTAPTEAVDNSYLAPVISNNATVMGKQNWLFMAGDSLDSYLGNNLPGEETLEQYAQTLARLKEVCDAKGKKLAILMVPEKPEIYGEYMPSFEVATDYKRIERIVDYVQEHTDVSISYPKDEMRAFKDYFLLYKKYDGHWNAMGSFVGYQMILKMLGMPMTNPLDVECEMYPVGSGGGDLIAPGKLELAYYQNDYDYTVHYKDNIGIYSTEGEWNRDYVHYRMLSAAECQESVALIGDSFRNHMMLYLHKDFADTTLIHIYMLGNETEDQVFRAADNIVMTYVGRNDWRMLKTAEYLIELLGD